MQTTGKVGALNTFQAARTAAAVQSSDLQRVDGTRPSSDLSLCLSADKFYDIQAQKESAKIQVYRTILGRTVKRDNGQASEPSLGTVPTHG